MSTTVVEFVSGDSEVLWNGTQTDWPVQLYELLNRVLAAALLILAAPLMLTIAALIWHRDGGPILFGHYRVGRKGRLFKCLKFRSMANNADKVLEKLLARDPDARAEWRRDHKLTQDPRITSFGWFLRRSSLDELPQLINVVRGEMALVGPRPIVVQELARYGRARWHYLSVLPGMTGLWQVSGRNSLTYKERVGLDRYYVENRTIAMDVLVLAKTIGVVLRGSGAK